MKVLALIFLACLFVFTSGCVQTDDLHSASLEYNEVLDDYREMVNVYNHYLDERNNNADLDPFEYSRNYLMNTLGEAKCGEYHFLIDIITFYRNVSDYDGLHFVSRDNFGYALKDLNGNGHEELVLLHDDYRVMAVFSLSNGSPILLDSFATRYVCAINNEGLLVTRGSGGASYAIWRIYDIAQDGSKLELIEEFGTDGHIVDTQELIYYKAIEGDVVYINQEDFSLLIDKYLPQEVYQTAEFEEITRKSGLVFVPLFSITGCEDTQSMPATALSSPTPPINEESANNISDLIVGVWNIRYAKNAVDGTDYSLQDYYGTGIQYGGKLTLYEDGTFSKYIGITSNETINYEGTYSVKGNIIQFVFGSGRIVEALYLPSSQEIEYPMQSIDGRLFYEYFSKN